MFVEGQVTELEMAKTEDAGEGSRRPPAVGRQIRRWRTDRGLTLAAARKASHLNVGYLSQIENDKASPSLACLAAIAGALDVPIAWFLIDETAAPEVAPRDGASLARDPGRTGQPRRCPRLGDIAIVEVTRRAGRSRPAYHSHEGDEHHVVLRGRYRMTQGEHVLRARTGRLPALGRHDRRTTPRRSATSRARC